MPLSLVMSSNLKVNSGARYTAIFPSEMMQFRRISSTGEAVLYLFTSLKLSKKNRSKPVILDFGAGKIGKTALTFLDLKPLLYSRAHSSLL